MLCLENFRRSSLENLRMFLINVKCFKDLSFCQGYHYEHIWSGHKLFLCDQFYQVLSFHHFTVYFVIIFIVPASYQPNSFCYFSLDIFVYNLELFYLNTIEQLFLFVEQLDQLEVCLPESRLLTGIPILAVFQNLR